MENQVEEEEGIKVKFGYDEDGNACLEMDESGYGYLLCNSPMLGFNITKPLYDMINKYKEVRVVLDPDMFNTKIKSMTEEEFLKYLEDLEPDASIFDPRYKDKWVKVNDNVKYLDTNHALYLLVKHNGLYYLFIDYYWFPDYVIITPFYVYAEESGGGTYGSPYYKIDWKDIKSGDLRRLLPYFRVELKFKDGKLVES